MKAFRTPIALLAVAGCLASAISIQAQSAAEVQKNLELFRLNPKYAGDYRSYADGRFNLNDLPAYQPRQAVSGWIKIHGAATLAQGRLAKLWEEGFIKFHPDVHFSYYLPTTEVALTPLYYHQADISLVHELGFYDILPYERVLNSQPLRIAAFTGSFDMTGYAPAYKIIVNKANPLTKITIDQLDAIFGAARDGGWVGTAWRIDLARGKEKNIRNWGQLGLTGDWAGHAIRPHGFSMRDPAGVSFNDRVMKGSDKWNEQIMTYGPRFDPAGRPVSVEEQLNRAVAADKYAIAYTLGGVDSPDVKVLSVAPASSGDYVALTPESVQSRQYPFFREGAIFVNLRPNGKLEPLVEEFLRYVLSRDGQSQVQHDGKYLPLNRETVEAQVGVVDAVGVHAVVAAPPKDANAEATLRTQALRAVAIAKRGEQRMYPPDQFDLSDLPPYKPKAILDGWIRIHGLNYIETGKLRKYWEEAFAKVQPGIKISWFLPTSAVGYASLYYNTADLLLGARRGLSDSLAYEKIMGRQPFAIQSNTGSFDLPGWANTPVIIVNDKNPLSKISMEQLDGVFGAERNGGWEGTTWHPEYARGPEKNIRTWGQLGLTGEWADKPIHVYGFNLRYNTSEGFSDRILHGSDKWNEDLVATGNFAKSDGKRVVGGDFIARAVAEDPYAIAYTNYSEEYKQPGDKVLDLAEKTAGPYVKLSIENARNRTYPMVNSNAFFMNETPGTPMNPLVKEFLSFILSREGQAEVQRDGKHLPLTAAIIAREREKLEKGWGSEP
ncbi:substrate-binding domain-containing protein [Opitutus sp. GAS368]|uniref:PstS family phosphate ABC transporter substrate-binding protein n=1 Tax=Opitutus sp. GAS368 TaxID=1882749 RepID=UPI0008796626|nr:substrate-binding domain-containing protein [Opitutus sp. GAS368]SDR90019.1 ABC-type phosphate transport system, substrate-binding protein [Opitutus sp. GAS368]